MVGSVQASRRPAALLPPAGQASVRLLVVSAWVVLVTVVAWLVLLLPAMPTGELGEQLAALREGMGMYRWGFVNAAVINPALVVMLSAATMVLARGPLRPHEIAGGILLAAYWVLPTLAYVSQFALLPRLLDKEAAELWYFGNPESVSYWLAMTGYGLFGIGAVLFASRFLDGTARVFGWVLLASGLASAVGLVGYGLANETLELGATLGGAMVVPLAILALLAARRITAVATPHVPG